MKESIRVSPEQHYKEIQKNLEYWKLKPVLRQVYIHFYQEIVRYINSDIGGEIVELGSGIGNLKLVVPECICTDIFPTPWIERVETAYKLSFPDSSVSHLILFDVFHHLEYPGTALQELYRVLSPGGRLILFEPVMSVLGMIVYGVFHHEPLCLGKKITWFAPIEFIPESTPYYAAQGNATRIFLRKRYRHLLTDWNLIVTKQMAAISYIASGGYSKPQLYPARLLPLMERIDEWSSFFPRLFATRVLIVLEKI